MRRYSLLYIAFLPIILLGVLNFIALSFYLYWTIWWFDILMHSLAGFALGLIAIWLIFDSGKFYRRSPTLYESIFCALAIVLIVGTGWEIFEYANGLTQSTESYALDTFHDLVSDTAGAVLAGMIAVKEIFRIRS